MDLKTVQATRCFGGMQGVYSHTSLATSGEMTFSVFLPKASDLGPFAVLYFLSGLTCTHENVTTKGGFQRVANELGVAVVCPDTSPRGTDYPGEHDAYDFGSGAGFYVDAVQLPWAQTYKMYTYIVEELPSVVEANFPVRKGPAGIFGHSMGGHGALTIGLKNPDRFGSISAFAPIVAPSQVPWGQKAFSGYLGDDKETWKNYDATELVASGLASQNTILIDQGEDDPFLAEQLRPELFSAVCNDRGQPVEIRMHPGYDHSYFFISTFMEDHLRHHAAILNV